MLHDLVPMMTALQALRVAGVLPSSLVSEAALRSIETAAARLPNAMDAAGFEARLGPADDRVDFATLTGVGSRGVDALARIDRAGGHPDLAPLRPWQAVAEFCRRWRQQVGERIPAIILEFDVPRSAGSPPIPCLFLRITRGPDGLRDQVAQLQRALPEFLGGGLLAARLRTLWERIPSGGDLLQVGLMLARGNVLRVYLAHPTAGVGDFLAGLGWPGDAREFQRLAGRYGDEDGVTELQLEFDEDVGRRSSVELSLGGAAPGSRRMHRLQRHLDRLLSDELCTQDQRAALLAWPGVHRAAPGHDALPLRVETDVSHLKVVMEAGLPPAAKAYFYFVPS